MVWVDEACFDEYKREIVLPHAYRLGPRVARFSTYLGYVLRMTLDNFSQVLSRPQEIHYILGRIQRNLSHVQ